MENNEFFRILSKNQVDWENKYGVLRTKIGGYCPITFVAWIVLGVRFEPTLVIDAGRALGLNLEFVKLIIACSDRHSHFDFAINSRLLKAINLVH